jgi:hypothetical protein
MGNTLSLDRINRPGMGGKDAQDCTGVISPMLVGHGENLRQLRDLIRLGKYCVLGGVGQHRFFRSKSVCYWRRGH